MIGDPKAKISAYQHYGEDLCDIPTVCCKLVFDPNLYRLISICVYMDIFNASG